MRNRNYRREQSKRVQKRRLRDLLRTWWSSIVKPSHLGKLKKNHFGCGCRMCKQWKHGKGDGLKISDKRKLDP